MSETDKQLKNRAVKIKGKDYVLVKDRVKFAAEEFDDLQVETSYDLIADYRMFVVKAVVTLNGQKFTGHSQAVIGGNGVNGTAALENAETSAVGRALGFAGIGVIDSIASADELNKALKSPTLTQTTQHTPQPKSLAERALQLKNKGSVEQTVDADSVVSPKKGDTSILGGVTYTWREGVKGGKAWSGWFPPMNSGAKIINDDFKFRALQKAEAAKQIDPDMEEAADEIDNTADFEAAMSKDDSEFESLANQIDG